MLITVFKSFLFPPAIQILLIALSLIVWQRMKRFAIVLQFIAWSSLLALSIPYVSSSLFVWLEKPFLVSVSVADLPQTQVGQPNIQAVVVLGAGRSRNNPEYAGKDQVSHHALWRLRYAAKVANELQVPLLISGGRVFPNDDEAEATLAEDVLHDAFNVNAVLLETNSRNTWENALYSAELLEQHNMDHIVLVTHAYHMRRAILAFQQTSTKVYPLATGFESTNRRKSWIDWIPTASALLESKIALHEHIGLAYYRIKAHSRKAN